MKLDTIKKLEELALNVEVTPSKRAFADGALLMTFTSLRFSDAQRLRSLEMNDDSVYGTLFQSKKKRPHGLPWHWERPLMGVTGSNQWVLPIFELHRAHAMTNGSIPSFVSPVSTTVGSLKKMGLRPTPLPVGDSRYFVLAWATQAVKSIRFTLRKISYPLPLLK